MTTGKWREIGVPHRGWQCVDVEDLGSPAAICEMCEVQEIRYVHVMAHEDYPDRLRVGCVCAEHMEGDYVGPRRREATLKRRAQRREAWPYRSGWRCSSAGNPWIKVEGFRVGLFRAGRAWGYWIKKPAGQQFWSLRNDLASATAAQLAAFDRLKGLR